MLQGQPAAFFQPFIDTATGRIAGVEALGRLRQADGSHASVGPLFADPSLATGDLLQLDRVLRDDALRRFAAAPDDWFLSLNLSPLWISQLEPGANLPSLSQLERSGIAPHRIVYEITEAAGDLPRLIEAVARYRAMGIRIAIDDFGSGYSQLDRVFDLQPDILKLDMRLFQAAARGGPRGDAVKALAQMAERTGCWLIAEGVETEAELDFALECGARYVQGFLFAEATAELAASEQYRERFAALRTRFVDAKLAQQTRMLELRQRLADFMLRLKPWAELGGPLSALPDPHEFPSLLRIYQCDRSGTQITPNLEWNGMFWRENRRYLNHNWSWRPYFYALLAEGWNERRLTLSTVYRDATTNQYCLTASQFMESGQRLLLIDLDASLLPGFASEGG
ncbi:EAL domain-containing protein [Pseudomonas sp. EpS/L25]|uniref:EAL domain-containing protein n=1 Tax=Pseudomonas sp. EpS/L25 TaxID=1749078 RepID=UPI000743B46B|nr:EAL domain-containing protein [Pseudomonas sp. EpS/L25]KUM44446.1 diguanylate phosphodiesterase [Pseudomonas sp. EpS/L25]